MTPARRQRVLFTASEMAHAIHKHGLPVEIVAAGAGHRPVIIEKVAEIARKGREVLKIAAIFESGFIVQN